MDEYYVALDGVDQDNNEGSLDNPWRTIHRANQTLLPGDTLILRGGTYNETIQPTRSGTEGAPITYRGYEGETVLITNVPKGANIDDRSWLTFRNLDIEDCSENWIYGSNAWHIVIEDCYFNNTFKTNSYSALGISDGGYLTIRGCRFGQWGDNTSPGGWGDMIRFRCSDYALIEENYFTGAKEENDFTGAKAGHSLLNTSYGTRYVIVRNNYFKNLWQKDFELDGDKTVDDVPWEGRYHLAENNVVLDATYNSVVEKGGIGLQFSSNHLILRHNVFVSNDHKGATGRVGTDHAGLFGTRIYNNTFYQNGKVGIKYTDHGGHTSDELSGNIAVNNIFMDNGDIQVKYDNAYGPHGDPALGVQVMFDFHRDIQYADNDVINNCFHQSGPGRENLIAVNGIGDHPMSWWETNHPNNFFDNIETDPKLVDPENMDFSLQADSPCIDAGRNLTTAVGSDMSSTSLEVADAMYFSDGFTLVDADWIKIGTGMPVQIQSVDYDTNEITLEDTRSWSDGDPVYLYKDSSGNVVLYGEAPDIGARPVFKYYVSTTGSDYNPGTLLEFPWKTLEYAFQQLRPGDTLLIRGGTYENDTITLGEDNSGLEDAPITVMPYEGETVTLTNCGKIHFNGAKCWVIKELVFEGPTSLPPSYDGATWLCLRGFIQIGEEVSSPEANGTASAHITIKNCHFKHSQCQGVIIWNANDVLIEGCYFQELKYRHLDHFNCINAISVLHIADNIVIRDNRFHDIGACGLQLGSYYSEGAMDITDITISGNEFWVDVPFIGIGGVRGQNAIDLQWLGGPVSISQNQFHGFRPVMLVQGVGGGNGDAIYIHDYAWNITIDRNRFDANTIHIAMHSKVGGIAIQNNLFITAQEDSDVKGRALRMGDVVKAEVYHNTFYDNDHYIDDCGNVDNCLFKNNAICKGEGDVDSDSSTWEADYNAWSQIAGTVPAELQGPNDQNETDLRLDSDLCPLPGSCLIDHGTYVGVDLDFRGIHRIYGEPDIGAYEVDRSLAWWVRGFFYRILDQISRVLRLLRHLPIWRPPIPIEDG